MASRRDEPDGQDERSLRKETWATLVDSIIRGRCTPFLGAGVAVPHLPTGTRLARELAERYEYPLDDDTNLARVTQYIASLYEPAFAKARVCERIGKAQRSAVETLNGGPPRNHLRLARLRLPMYVTTNYDDYLQRAIAAVSGSSPDVEICKWNDRLAQRLPPYAGAPPTASAPKVFHLHGHLSEEDSILVTEDDFIDFTANLAGHRTDDNPIIPHYVRRALGDTNLLFIGYSLEDWNFRVLMRHLMKQQAILPHTRHSSVSIQLSNQSIPEERRKRAQKFLEVYLKTSSSIEVYWGDAGPFLEELLRQVDEARAAS